ncbi:MAG TPA: PAS domain-containing protein, partial [Gemmatimonadaceae bacterium]|nr:PAS domain-containing protein [Gemmatimonadaceae bacterium]
DPPDGAGTDRPDAADRLAEAPAAATRDVSAIVEDATRLDVLRATRLLDASAEPAFDRLTRLAVRLLDVPTAFFSLVDETRDFYLSACGMGDAPGDARELTGVTFCRHAIQSRRPLVIPDTRADPRYRDIPTVTTLGVASYVGVPVIVNGQAIGSFCVIDTVPRAWSDAQVEVLSELAVSAQREIELRGAVATAQEMATSLQEQAARLAVQASEAESVAVSAQALARALDIERHRLADVFAQAPSFLAVLRGPEFVFELVNDAYERIIGLGRNVIGKPFLEAIPEARGQGLDRHMAQVRATGDPLILRDHPIMIERSGAGPLEQRFVDVIYLPLMEADGTHDAIIAHGTDVTQQVMSRRALETAEQAAQRNAAQLRAFADAIPTLAWMARPDGHVTWYNARWYEYTGTTPAEMEGWGWQRVHDPGVLPSVMECWRQSLAMGTPFEMAFPLRSAEGAYRTFLTRILPSHDTSGAVTGWFGSGTDIEVESGLRKVAEDANRAKGQFLAVMSHELRTPLNAIDGYAELMELEVRGPVTLEQRNDLARIRKSQRHLLALINGVLNYARVEAGAVHYEREAVPIDEVLATCEALTLPQAQGRGLTLYRQPCDDGMVVRADQEKVQQVVLNLLSNAIKFTDAGGRVTLSCARGGDTAHPVIH